ncbi:MAG: GTPase [Clostridiales bacterium]|nr:GTPase [Clostridiales bacterium]
MAEYNEELRTPIYLITGFLESGKTNLIKNMLTDEGFSQGERTLLIVCEEGEEEYEKELLRNSNTVMEVIDSFEDLTENSFQLMNDKYFPERIIIEYNSVWGIENLFRIKKPAEWELAQMVTLIDASTFENYLTNMRNLMTEGPKLADLVIFNRCSDETPKSSYRRIIKGMNNTCNILFENLDGTSDDGVGEEDLPYDMKADVIEIKDDQFGIWYIDCMEHPARYNERKIRVKGMGFRLEDLPRKTYVFGRYAMTCCADDIGGIGFICRYKEKFPKEKEWFYLNAKIEAAYSEIHGRAAVILVEESREKAEKPEEELVYFG